MKVLMVIDTIKAGGKERRMLELLKRLIVQQYEIELVVLSNEIRYDDYFGLGITIHQVARRHKFDLAGFWKIFGIARRFRPDYIHSWSSMSSVFALPAAKLLGIPFINAMIADAPQQVHPRHKWRAQITFPFSDHILSNSKAGLRSYKAPAGRSDFIHNGFDFQRTESVNGGQKLSDQLGISTPYVVGMIGRLHGHKDYDTYLDAALELVHQREDVSFLAIGEGPRLPELRERYEKAGMGRIIFTGRLKNIESVIALFDIGVLTTNLGLHGEGISNAIMEYMALGKPCIATDGGGTAELLLDGKTGYLIAEGDRQALATKINFLLDKPEQAREMGERGKQRIREHFSMDRMTEEFVTLYEQPGTLR